MTVEAAFVKRATKNFKKYIGEIRKYEDEMTPAEKSAFDVLYEFWRRGRCDEDSRKTNEGLIDSIRKDLNKHAANLDLKEALNDFISLCEIWYFDEEKFNEYQKAMGGHEPKPIIGTPERPAFEPTTPKPPQPSQIATGRLDFTNGYYIGEYRDGIPNGMGHFYFNNGDWEEGTYVNGNLHGVGTMRYESSRRTDHGEYSHGNRVGTGRMDWDDGNWYTGQWNDKGKHGKGIAYIIEHKRTDEGDYVDNRRKGHGVMQWINGDRYEGTWDDTSGTLTGEGTYYYANGTFERGKWMAGKWTKTVAPANSPTSNSPIQTSTTTTYDPVANAVITAMMNETMPIISQPSPNYFWSISSLIAPLAIVLGWIPVINMSVSGISLLIIFLMIAGVFILPIWAIVSSAKVKKAPGLSSAFSCAKRAKGLSITTLALAVALFFISRNVSATLPETSTQTTEERVDLKNAEDGTKATSAANNTKPKTEQQKTEQPKAERQNVEQPKAEPQIEAKESAAVQQTAPANNTAVTNPKSETPPPPRVSIGSMTTPSRQIEMKATTAELLDNGKTFRMDFVLINHGGNIDKHSLRGSSYGESKAYDNEGNLCYITLAVGGGSYYGDYENAPLPSNVPVKVSIKITRFGSSATSFPLITIVGCGPNSVAGCEPYIYEFKNVAFR
jgi:hypothetical protein